MFTRPIALVCFVAVLPAHAAWAVMSVAVDESTRSYTVTDGGESVLRYNFGTVPVPPGVKGKYAVARSNYVHPLYGPGGEMLTTDYAPDHPHHRAIYWAWPEVRCQGKLHDLHALQGVFARPVKIHRAASANGVAVIDAESVWKWEDKEPIVNERAVIRVHPVVQGARAIDFEFRFEAVKPGVTLARRGKKNYGGLNFRLSARQGQKISHHNDSPDSLSPKSWGVLSGIPPEGKAPVAVAILQNATNPGYPGDWVEYPKINWLQPAFPASGAEYTLKPGEPLSLSYRVVIAEGTPNEELLAALWRDYNGPPASPFKGLSAYKFGDDRTALARLEKALLKATQAERKQAEADLVSLLEDGAATVDIKQWACRRLEEIGTKACVPALSGLLGDQALGGVATMALIGIPDEAAGSALRAALPGARDDAKVALIKALGARRDKGSVASVAGLLIDANPAVAGAAIEALGRIGSASADKALASAAAPEKLAPLVSQSRLWCAERAVEQGATDRASTAYRAVWQSKAPAHLRGAALVGLAQSGDPSVVELALTALGAQSTALQRAAVAALRDASGEEASRRLASRLDGLPTPIQIAAINVLASRGHGAVIDAVTPFLTNQNEALSLASIGAVAKLGGAQQASALANLLTEKGAVGKAAEDALVRLGGEETGPRIQQLARQSAGASQAALVDCVAARDEPGMIEALIKLGGSEDAAVAKRALSALGRVATPDRLGELIDLFASAKSKKARGEAGKAIVAVAKRSPDTAAAAKRLIAATKDQPSTIRADALALLPKLGGDEALQEVRQALSGNDDDLRQAAVRALSDWPDEKALPDLTQLLDREQDAKGRVLAARGIARLILPRAGKPGLAGAAAKEALTKALPHLADAELTRQAKAYLVGLSFANLALKRPATSSRPTVPAHKPEHAVDGVVTLASYWESLVPDSLLMVDLGGVQPIQRIHLHTYWDGSRYYQYTIDVSTDGKTWETVVDQSKNTKPSTPEGREFVFAPRKARHVRVHMLKGSANPGQHIVELAVYEKKAPKTSGENLAVGKPVKSSGQWQGGYKPEMAVDGKVALNSYWSHPTPGGWLELDLQKPTNIGAIHLFTHWGGKRYYQYTIEVSSDGKTWRQVVDRSRNTSASTPKGDVLPITPTQARYVRVNMLKHSLNPGQHVVELKVFEAE